MKITVAVTQDDIDHGIAGNCHECPVARAVRRLFPGLHVQVGALLIVIGRFEVAMPPRVRRFVVAFDIGRRPRPLSFDLDVPDHLLAAVARG